mmetsp:Transcript_7823/g.11812  ORF Transcript_7823/g.11812 Transcript_7823/m.11812 type:complete len:306 (-) Transcript_7823:169-1086(-)
MPDLNLMPSERPCPYSSHRTNRMTTYDSRYFSTLEEIATIREKMLKSQFNDQTAGHSVKRSMSDCEILKMNIIQSDNQHRTESKPRSVFHSMPLPFHRRSEAINLNRSMSSSEYKQRLPYKSNNPMEVFKWIPTHVRKLSQQSIFKTSKSASKVAADVEPQSIPLPYYTHNFGDFSSTCEERLRIFKECLHGGVDVRLKDSRKGFTLRTLFIDETDCYLCWVPPGAEKLVRVPSCSVLLKSIVECKQGRNDKSHHLYLKSEFSEPIVLKPPRDFEKDLLFKGFSLLLSTQAIKRSVNDACCPLDN